MKCPFCGRENDGAVCTKCHAEVRFVQAPVKKPEKTNKTKHEDKERS